MDFTLTNITQKYTICLAAVGLTGKAFCRGWGTEQTPHRCSSALIETEYNVNLVYMLFV